MVVLSCKPYKMSPNQFLTSISTLLEVFSQLATCQLRTIRAISRAPMRLWMPERKQKKAMGKADWRVVDSEITIGC